MKGIKRLLWLCAALCLMALAATGCGMLADNTVYATVSEGVLSADGSFYYDLYENGTVAVTGRTAADKHMVIPEKIDGHAVVAIGNGAFRDDVAERRAERSAILADAPQTDGAFFIVPRIVEGK